MRQLLPGRYSLDDATFSRASMAHDEAGRLAGLAVPRIAKTPYGKMALIEEGVTNLLLTPFFSFDTNSDGVADNWDKYGTSTYLTYTTPTCSGWSGKCQRIEINNVAHSSNTGIMQVIGTAVTPDTSLTIRVIGKTNKSQIKIAFRDITNGVTYSYQSINVTPNTEFNITASSIVPSTCTSVRIYLEMAQGAAWNVGDYIEFYSTMTEPKEYATTPCVDTRAVESLTLPTTGLSVTEGTIEGIVEINDNSKRQDGTTNYFCNLSGGVYSNAIAFMHLGTSAYYRLSVWDDTGSQSYVSISDSLISNGFYYYKVYWDISAAIIELWDLLTQNKITSETISDLTLPSAFGSYMYLGSRNGNTYYPNTRFGRHRLSDIVRTDDPDFNNLMPVDANTVGIFDPTYTFLT